MGLLLEYRNNLPEERSFLGNDIGDIIIFLLHLNVSPFSPSLDQLRLREVSLAHYPQQNLDVLLLLDHQIFNSLNCCRISGV